MGLVVGAMGNDSELESVRKGGCAEIDQNLTFKARLGSWFTSGNSSLLSGFG